MLETQENTQIYTVTGASRVFPFSVPFFEPDNIYCFLEHGGEVRQLVRDTEFTVAQLESYAHGANITLAFDIGAIGDKLAIVRIVPYTQMLDLPLNGKIPSDATETQLDRMEAQIQQIAEELRRAFKSDYFSNGSRITVSGIGVLLSSGGWTAYHHKNGAGQTDGGHIILGEDSVAIFSGVPKRTISSGLTINNGLIVNASGGTVGGTFAQVDAEFEYEPRTGGSRLLIEGATVNAQGSYYVRTGDAIQRAYGDPFNYTSKAYSEHSEITSSGAIVALSSSDITPIWDFPKTYIESSLRGGFGSTGYAFSATIVRSDFAGQEDVIQEGVPFEPAGADFTPDSPESSWDYQPAADYTGAITKLVYDGSHGSATVSGALCNWDGAGQANLSRWTYQPGGGETDHSLAYLARFGFCFSSGVPMVSFWNHSQAMTLNSKGEYEFVLSGLAYYHYSGSWVSCVFTPGEKQLIAGSRGYTEISGAIALTSMGSKTDKESNRSVLSGGSLMISGGYVGSSSFTPPLESYSVTVVNSSFSSIGGAVEEYGIANGEYRESGGVVLVDWYTKIVPTYSGAALHVSSRWDNYSSGHPGTGSSYTLATQEWVLAHGGGVDSSLVRQIALAVITSGGYTVSSSITLRESPVFSGTPRVEGRLLVNGSATVSGALDESSERVATRPWVAEQVSSAGGQAKSTAEVLDWTSTSGYIPVLSGGTCYNFLQPVSALRIDAAPRSLEDATILCHFSGGTNFLYPPDLGEIGGIELSSGFYRIAVNAKQLIAAPVSYTGPVGIYSDDGPEGVTSTWVMRNWTVSNAVGGDHIVYNGGAASNVSVISSPVGDGRGALRVSGGYVERLYVGESGIVSATGGTISSLTVSARGTAYIYGAEVQDLSLRNGGATPQVRVSNGGIVSGVRTSGVCEFWLYSGGRAEQIDCAISTFCHVSGGAVVTGGSFAGTRLKIIDGGIVRDLTLAMRASGDANNGVFSGGVIHDCLIAPGGIYVVRDGTAYATTIGSSGARFIVSGGTASAVTISSGGTLTVSSGGTALAVVSSAGAVVSSATGAVIEYV